MVAEHRVRLSRKMIGGAVLLTGISTASLAVAQADPSEPLQTQPITSSATAFAPNPNVSGAVIPEPSDIVLPSSSALATPTPGVEFPTPVASPSAAEPTDLPPTEPTVAPSEAPVPEPTAEPTAAPEPTTEPTATPSETPAPQPPAEPTVAPSEVPVPEPTVEPTSEPAPVVPAPEPTAEPTATPSEAPAPESPAEPTTAPTPEPSADIDQSLPPSAVVPLPRNSSGVPSPHDDAVTGVPQPSQNSASNVDPQPSKQPSTPEAHPRREPTEGFLPSIAREQPEASEDEIKAPFKLDTSEGVGKNSSRTGAPNSNSIEGAADWVESFFNRGEDPQKTIDSSSGVARTSGQNQSATTALTNEALTRGQAVIEGYGQAILFSLLGVGIIFFVTREFTRSTRKND
ncbi:hypothetical protein [uncultured Rothia sp.]|uniref:hypothetical protein n=1 Tax=uncultured Rothia sp. TaxID=316088 RepID=UPI0032169134